MNLAYYVHPIDRLHQENLQFLKAQRYRAGVMPFAQQVEKDVAAFIRRLGYIVVKTGHNHPFDFKIVRPDRQCIRLEVKGSQPYYLPKKHSWRYQANIHHKQVDLIIFACVDPDGFYHHFIIPAGHIRQGNIAIWSKDPAAYAGQWASFREAWSHLDQAFHNSQPYSEQLTYISGEIINEHASYSSTN